MSSRAWMLRLAALLGAGDFAVHESRYALGYGADASEALAAQGHAYLIAVGPLLAAALVLVLAEVIRRVAHGGGAPAPRFGRLWGGTALALLAVYAAQELVEGLVAAHHPDGLAGVAGHGGWIALPLALLVALGIALAMRGASAAAELAESRRPWRVPRPSARVAIRVAGALPGAARAGAPRTVATRGPPLPSV